MKKELKQTLFAAKITLLVLWPVSAWAASITFGGQMAQIPMLDVLLTVVLSTLMGATSLLHAMIEEYKKAPEIPRLGLFVSSRMLGANAAGLLMFFVTVSLEVRTSYMTWQIMLAAFGGHLFVSRAYRAFVHKNLPEQEP